VSYYEDIQKKRDIIVGVFVLVAVAALFWMVFKFGDLPVAVSRFRAFEVMVQFPTASGVEQNTPVRFCGYQVGRVTKIKPPKILRDFNTSRFYHQTVVVMNIDKSYDNIPANVEVKLMTRGLGSSYIDLKEPPFNIKEIPSKFLKQGSILQGSTGITSEFFPEESQKKLEQLVTGLYTFIKNANDILGDEANKANIKSTLANLSEATKQSVETLKKIQEFTASGNAAFEQLSGALAEMRIVLEKVDSGEGTAAKLVNDGRLYEELLETTYQLKALVEEMKSFIAQSKEKGVPIKLK
jgi:phospholipid/cholesterol/gamma-HCH transport system substrate-binding protein